MDDGQRATYTPAAAPRKAPADAPLAGRVCVVTGASRGIGKATAAELARLGGTVVLLARDAAAGQRAVEDVRSASGSADVSLVVADLASRAAVRAAAAELRRRAPAIHVLVNNAGVSLPRRRVTPDGTEATLAVNHLAPFLLTHLLLDALAAAAPGTRVVNVSSEFERWGRIRFDDLQGERRYNGTRAYVQSKLANVMFTYELAERLARMGGGGGIAVNCVYPGLVATDLLRDNWWWRARWLRPLWRRIFLTPEAAARTVAWVAAAPEVEGVTGRCFAPKGGAVRAIRTSRRSYDAEARRRLWRASAELCGLPADPAAHLGAAPG